MLSPTVLVRGSPARAKFAAENCFEGWLTLTFKVKFNFKINIYPILSLWVCPRHRSPLIKVRISKFGPKMHLSTVKVSMGFGIDWAWSSVSFLISDLLFSTKLCVSYSFASFCIYLVRPSPVSVPHPTWLCTYTDYYARGQGSPWTMKQSTFISWWDHWSLASLDLAISTGFYKFLSVFAL